MKYHPVVLLVALGSTQVPAVFAQAPADKPADDKIVQLSPFELSTDKDVGYRPSNSVSATRMDVPLSDLPVTINAFTQEFINDLKPRDLIDIVRYAPGVTNANPEFVGGQAIFNIRGFNTNANLRNGFAGPAVLDASNIARVEVVKGPASLLYGNIEPGGVVNYITKRPEAKPFTELTQSFGTDGYYRSEVDTTGPLGGGGNNTLLYRFVGAYDHAADYYGPSKRIGQSLAPSLVWTIGPKTEISFDYESFTSRETPPVLTMEPYLDNNGILIGPATDFGIPWDFNAASNQDYRISDARTWTVDAKTDIDGWNLRGAFNKYTQKVEQFSTAALFGTSPAAPSIPRRGRIQFDRRISDSYQFEVNKTFDIEVAKLDVLVGYQEGKTEQTGSQRNLPQPLPPAWDLKNPSTWNRDLGINLSLIPYVNPFEIDDKQDGVYAVLHASTLKNKLHLLAGLRHSTADSVTLSTSPAGVVTRSGILHANENTPQLGALYQIVPAVAAYVSYSKSFRPEGGSLTINNVVGAAPKQPLIGEGYDAGLKFTLDDGRLTANLALYTLDYLGTVTERVVGFDPITNNPILTDSQNGKDRSRGVEFDFLWIPDAHWQVYGAYAYLDSVAVTNTDPTVIGVQRAGTAKNTASVYAKYSFTDGRLKGFAFSGGPRYTGPLRADPLSQYYYRSVTVVDLLASYGWGMGHYRYSVDLNIRNLFDEKYYDSIATTRGDPLGANLSFQIRL